MGELVSAPLDLEQFQADSHTHPVHLEVWSYWYEHGYPVDELTDAYSVIHVKEGVENSSHVVCRVQSLEMPLDEADAAVDDTVVYSCDCRDYQYNRGVDLEEERLPEWGDCIHIEEVKNSDA